MMGDLFISALGSCRVFSPLKYTLIQHDFKLAMACQSFSHTAQKMLFKKLEY
jgi:hypothetical protein